MVDKKQVKLILEDNSIFYGFSFGSEKSVSGEVVFNTGMVGYPETMTDPSYKGQILVLTYPLIGNYGIPSDDQENNLKKHFESDKIHLQGLIVSDYSKDHNHWNSEKSLSGWMKEQDIPGIYGIDTRELTKKLRENGTMLGKIICNDNDIVLDDPNKRNLVSEVSVKESVIYNEQGDKKVVVIDCGVKNNIIRCLVERNCCVIKVPWDYDFFKHEFDAVLISNGPGNPKMCKETINNVKKCLEKDIPTFGICLGNQILALAADADTYKLKYGHRSQNQPCIEVGTKRCYITSQNHGYAVDTKTLPEGWLPWFENANDGTNEGIKHKTKPFMSFQGHPEHYPGPVDTNFLFDKFIENIGKDFQSQKFVSIKI
ncbi:MAG: glutamine-hydrolyzing carbamoyl-phosphate synthase small subunit [Candidatus Woesearchaeota archaeon]|jgi:carbamoyl-phosphate synthase small subunit|nr:glutamine-hydrolyzing carbamoyl-phosphate synthase small subunit [Candidatus Woesearchaeota archaeon]MDP7506713.1 glutamine-hydrolyzing carbamoyl-phosphate synthase small subunit [Candidatus Woesearchaeota archaeon]|tara:strand:+ start:12537 stop:13649 length:1113 start_codon:yes stop_codon:yes gene_type:complete